MLQPIWAQNSAKTNFVLSERIGLEIDSVEAEYFNLFPDLDGVKSAVYRLDNFDNLRILVSQANGRDTTLLFSKLATEELKKYIDKHEILVDSQKIINWELLPGYRISKLNYFENHGSTVFVYTKDAKVVAGKLLRITEDAVIVWTSKQPFRPENWLQYAQKVDFSNIERISRKQDLTGRIFGVSLGAGIGIALFQIGFGFINKDNESVENTLLLIAGGALVGGGLGLLYDGLSISRRKYKVFGDAERFKSVSQKLRGRAIFRSVYPPELKNL